MIISKLLPEFEFESNFCRRLYANPRFLELRKAYKERYGYYPVALVEKYNCQMHEYSRAVTPQIRQAGNRLSGLAETAYASLLA